VNNAIDSMQTVCAEERQAEEISAIIRSYSEKSLLLTRSPEEIRKNITTFKVICSGSEVIGCCSLYIYSPRLGEVRSLAVKKDFQKKGYGILLVKSIIEMARKKSISRLFTLTMSPGFFLKLGFSAIDRALLPEKVWNDCSKCSRHDNCPETALILNLSP